VTSKCVLDMKESMHIERTRRSTTSSRGSTFVLSTTPPPLVSSSSSSLGVGRSLADRAFYFAPSSTSVLFRFPSNCRYHNSSPRPSKALKHGENSDFCFGGSTVPDSPLWVYNRDSSDVRARGQDKLVEQHPFWLVGQPAGWIEGNLLVILYCNVPLFFLACDPREKPAYECLANPLVQFWSFANRHEIHVETNHDRFQLASNVLCFQQRTLGYIVAPRPVGVLRIYLEDNVRLGRAALTTSTYFASTSYTHSGVLDDRCPGL